MEFIRPGINIDFVGKRKLAYAVSSALMLATILILILRGGPNYGVDFTGGMLMQLRLPEKRPVAEIKEALANVRLGDSLVQEFTEEGKSEYILRLRTVETVSTVLSEEVTKALVARFGAGSEIRRVEMVGPQVGKDLREKALLAIFYAVLFMAVYISGRFEMKWTVGVGMALCLSLVTYAGTSLGLTVNWLIVVSLLVTLALCWVLRLRYALGATIALIHDVTITLGALALTNREISLTTVAALLTIVGYSLNDTIIIFDRIRENRRRERRMPLDRLINQSVNQTLSRTVLTSGTTLMTVTPLFLFGGGLIHDFAFALMVGFVVGTYSTVYVASPIVLLFEKADPASPSRR